MRHIGLYAALLPWLPVIYAQSRPFTITIGVGYCSTSRPFGYGSMTSGAAASATSSSLPFPSAASYKDSNGQTYSIHYNTGLSGQTTNPSAPKRRQEGDHSATNGTFEQCLESCDATPACQAVNYLGTTCMLYSAVKGEMYLVGGEVAYYLARFRGFTNETDASPSASSMAESTPMFSPMSSMPPSSTPGAAPSENMPPAVSTTPPPPDSTSMGVAVSSPSAAASSVIPSTPIGPSFITSSNALKSSSSSSTSSSTSQSATPSGICPTSDGNAVNVTDPRGVIYTVSCASDTLGALLDVKGVTSSFQQCFAYCDANSACTGFTYSGGTNGNGAGNCYLKSGTLGFVRANTGLVSGIRSTLSSFSSVSSSTFSSTLSPSRTSTTSTSTVAATPTYVRNTGKRGLCYTNDTLTLPFALSGQNSQVSWEYDYFYSRFTGTNPNNTNPALTFIPLMFSDATDLGAVWPAKAQAAIAAGADALMSFNEPDYCIDGSACMSVNASVAGYQKYFMPFADTPGVRLGAPAVTNQGVPGGLTYLQNFLGNCTGCQIDFIVVHWYSNKYAGLGYLQSFIQQAYAQFGRPIWLTEFGLDNSEGTPSDADVQTFLQKALPWLDAYPHVERYAYFYDGPGFLINANGSGLSARGTIYNSYTAACANWNQTTGHC